ncbi:MAG TPA: glycoside hydrolase family 3 N-terminal domain-containing protein [Capillimicrobium sp.]|nr:glycoside hydrolase family 3 N-terminal domain-containing protein [Capillimicrobium sp.]
MPRLRLAVLAAPAFVAAMAVAVALLSSRGDHGAPDRRPAPAGAATGAAAADPIGELSLRQLAGTTVVLRFHGTRAPAYVRRALRERRAAGVILFADNLTTPDALRAMTAELHAANPGALVMVDQEGGDVRIVPWAGPETGQAWRATPREGRAVAARAGRQLRALGVDVVLGPVADAGRPGTALASRSFAGDIPALTAATVRGWLAGGVLPTAKHFPGLGAAATNTDDAAATVAVDRAELDAVDLPPFAAAIEAGAPLVMASLAVYPALDPDRPASQSRAILTGLLRGELGFDGVVITDSLEAEAVRARPSTPGAAVRAMAAGADLLLTTGRGSYLPVLEAVAARAARDDAFRARVREAAARVLALQERAARR